jgi:DNA polymerase-3 subunit epsilon
MALADVVFRVVDIETTGLSPYTDEICEVAYVLVNGRGEVLDRGETLVRPDKPIHPAASAVHGLKDNDVQDAPPLAAIRDVLPRLFDPVLPMVAHNAQFDFGFLRRDLGISAANTPRLCTLRMSRALNISSARHGLDHLRGHFGLVNRTDYPSHRAGCDADAPAQLFALLLEMYASQAGEDSIEGLAQRFALPDR